MKSFAATLLFAFVSAQDTDDAFNAGQALVADYLLSDSQDHEFTAVTGATATDASLSGVFTYENTYLGVSSLRCKLNLTAPVAFFGPQTYQMVYFQIEEPAHMDEDEHDHERLLQDEVVETGTGNYEGNALLFLAPGNNVAADGTIVVTNSYDLLGTTNCSGDNKYYSGFCTADKTITFSSDSW